MQYAAPSHIETVAIEDALGTLSAAERVNAPARLHLAGDRALVGDAPRVAIVGSRKASSVGAKMAGALARELGRRGVVVVSGLAAGIDKAAHDGAMRGGGRTIGVIGTPLDRVYPAGHARLQETVYGRHLLVSQFPSGQRTRPFHFVARNWTMALLSHVSVLVEAADGSGTLSHAREMLRLGRTCVRAEEGARGLRARLAWVSRLRRCAGPGRARGVARSCRFGLRLTAPKGPAAFDHEHER